METPKNMQPFIVTFRFATMPIIRGSCTLDAVLGGEIAHNVDDLEEAIRMTPLACSDGVFHGSSLILLDDTRVDLPVPIVQKSRSAFYEIDPSRISCGRRRAGRPWAKNLLNRYEARLCEGGAWLGVGQMERVEELLRSILGIGKRRHSGWGMIEPESLEVEPVDASPQTWGLVTGPDDPDFQTDRIRPRRPLPIEMFERLGGKPLDEVIAVERVRQPYYDANNPPVPVVLP